MKKILLSLLVLCLSAPAFAGLPEDFQAMNAQSKGPFGKNMLQGTKGRTEVTAGSPAGSLLFQAAYRVGAAEKMVRDYGFYTGNLNLNV